MINIDALNDEEKLAALESIHKSIAESKEIQRKKITTNVEMIVKALKKIEADLKQRYDETGQLIANLKSGEDGRDGKDGKDGKNGKDGRDGPMGPRGYDGVPGRNGLDGTDGVSVTDAHIDFDGSLIISLSSGRVINVGEVVAADIAEKIKVITNGGGTSQSVLDAIASLQAQIDAFTGGLDYQGTWNASTNTPTLTSSVGTNGYYYVVSTAGSTNLNGVTDWQVGDWAVFNGTIWQKIDQTNLVTSVAGRTGAIVLTTADIGGLGTIATQAANNVSITGGSITGITDLAIADGGTGASTAAAAITALTGTQTAGYYLRSNGTGAFLSGIQAADVPTLNQNTTGSASTITNTLPISKGGTNLTSLTNKGVLYASSTSQVATGTALQFDGNNLGVSTTPSAWSSAHRAIEIGDQTSVSFFSSGATKVSTFATNIYNVSTIGARDYYKANGVAAKYTQYTGEHVWSTAPSGIAGPTTGITTGRVYTNLTAGNQPDFGASDGFVGTIWTATSSGTLSSGTVVQNVDFVESMRIDTSSNVGIGTSSPGSRLDVKGTLRLSGSTSGYVGFAPAATAGSTTYTLPSADGTANQALVTNGSGTLSWASTATGTVTSVGGTGTVSGLTLTGTVTSSGNLTLGGTLDLSAYNGAGAFTTLSASGVATFSAGSASAPAISRTGDTNTGIFFPAADTIAFAEGGTEVMRLDSSGNLGIGTTSSLGNASRLSVQVDGSFGGIGFSRNTDNTFAVATDYYKSRGSAASPTAVQNGDDLYQLRSVPYQGSAYTYLNSMVIQIDGTYTSGQNPPTRILWYTNTANGSATERLRLDSSGNLGLGVTPSAWSGMRALQLGDGAFAMSADGAGAGDGSLTWNGYYNGTNWIYGYTGGGSSRYRQNESGHAWFYAPSGTAGNAISFTQAMTLDASGNLLVGTTSALLGASGRGNITVNGSSNSIFTFGISNATSGYIYSSASNLEIDAQGSRFIQFNTNGSERARIDSSGSLLVGTTSNPVSDKVLFASAQATNNSLALITTDDASNGTFIAFRNSASTAIGTIQRVTTTNAVVYNTTSDYRLKTVTGSVTGQGARIDALKPVDYLWKEGNQQARGFLAHEFQAVYPNSVSGDKDAVDANGNPEYQAMQAATSEVIADLVAEIQSLRKRLADAGI
jgi:hypothetical protein